MIKNMFMRFLLLQMSSQGARIIYKRLLRYGRSLTYTNKDYFYRRVR